MSILKFIRSLLPIFGKDRVLEDARIIKTELQTVTIPSYLESEKVFHNWTFKSKEAKDFATVFARNFKSSKGDNFIVAIRKALEVIIKIHELNEDKLEKTLEDKVVSEGITVLKANLIRIVELTRFVANYSLAFLNYIYVLESEELKVENGYTREMFSPAEIEWFNKGFLEFVTALAALARSPAEFEKLLDKIPDITITAANGEPVTGTYGPLVLDPLNVAGFSSVTKNPIYHVGLLVAEIQANSYKRSKETKKILELRLLSLQLTMEKNPDAKLEQEINYIQSRIQDLNSKIQKQAEGV